MFFKIVLLEIFVLSVISVEDSSIITPLLHEYYLKEPRFFHCNGIEQRTASSLLECLSSNKVIGQNVWYCDINETLMRTNSIDYTCITSSLRIENQPFFEPECQEKLEDSDKLEMLKGSDITVSGGQIYGDELPNYQLKSELEYLICFYNMSLQRLEVYSAHKKDICYEQKVALNLVYHFYDNTFFWIFIPTLIISILFTALIIGVYLYHEKLRSLYFGKCVICHSLSYMLHQLLYVHNYDYFTNKTVTCFEGTLLVLQMAFQFSSNCWMSVLTFETYSSLRKYDPAILY